MNISVFASHRPFTRALPARARLRRSVLRLRPTLGHLRLPAVNRPALRAWLDQPGPEPTPAAALMYGLLLRPVDRQDVGGDRR